MKHLFGIIVFAGTVSIAAPAMAGTIIATTSDYETGNTAVFRTGNGAFSPNALGHADQDVVADTDGEYVYFLERSRGAVSKFAPDRLSAGEVVWQYSVGPTSNPQDIVFLDDRAYVIRAGTGSVLKVNRDAASASSFAIGEIDLSGFDTDSVPDAVHGFLAGGRVYVVCQRLHGFAADTPGLLVAIDPATDAVIDLDPDALGVQGRELLVKNPQSFSQVGGMLYIGGHVWGAQTEGVQTVDAANPLLPQAMLAGEASNGMDITGAAVFSASLGIVMSASWVQDSGGNWIQVGAAYWFDPRTGALGQPLPVPAPEGGAVFVDGVVYVGSRDNSNPGLYRIDPASNAAAGEPLITTLPPVSMIVTDTPPVMVDAGPTGFELRPPFPNPFNPAATVTFSIDSPGRVRAAVFSLAGQRVAVLSDRVWPAGTHALTWNAGGFPSGMYLARVSANGFTRSVSMTLVK